MTDNNDSGADSRYAQDLIPPGTVPGYVVAGVPARPLRRTGAPE